MGVSALLALVFWQVKVAIVMVSLSGLSAAILDEAPTDVCAIHASGRSTRSVHLLAIVRYSRNEYTQFPIFGSTKALYYHCTAVIS